MLGLALQRLLPRRAACALPRMDWRSIITVDVRKVGPRDGGGAAHRDIVRAEESAIMQFNSIVRSEQALGSLHKGGRRMKRLSRFVKPTLRRRQARWTAEYRKHMAKMSGFMNWIQYRQRKNT